MLMLNFFTGLSLPFTLLSPCLYPFNGMQLQIRYPSQDWIKPGSILDVLGK